VQASWESYLERLGPLGVRLTLAALLDAADAAALAGAEFALEDPRQRAEALADLLAVDPEKAPQALELLDARAGTERIAAEDEDGGRARLIEAIKNPDLAIAPLLHRLARAMRPGMPIAELRAAAEVIAPAALGEDLGSRPKYMAKIASEKAGLRELEQERRELEARVRQLETQLARALERTADSEDRLQRLTTERHDARVSERDTRDERQRLEREVTRLSKRIEELNERRAREGTGEITTALRRLTSEQRRVGAGLDKLRNREVKERESVRDLSRRISALGDVFETLLQQHEAGQRAAAVAQEAILRQLAQLAELHGTELEGDQKVSRPRRAAAPDQARVALFVDVQNMFYGAREKGARLDFEALLQQVTEQRQLVRAVAYVVETREIDQRGFIHLLEMKAWEVKRKPLRIRPDRTMKGNWDLEIAIDALRTAPSVDVVVLVTGDGDFVPLVRQLKMMGKRIEVIGFTKSSAPDLREAADRFFPVTRRLLRPIDPRKADRAAERAAARAARTDSPAEPADQLLDAERSASAGTATEDGDREAPNPGAADSGPSPLDAAHERTTPHPASRSAASRER
jgi:uncharacterized LabA/DUF88 family protein